MAQQVNVFILQDLCLLLNIPFVVLSNVTMYYVAYIWLFQNIGTQQLDFLENCQCNLRCVRRVRCWLLRCMHLYSTVHRVWSLRRCFTCRGWGIYFLRLQGRQVFCRTVESTPMCLTNSRVTIVSHSAYSTLFCPGFRAPWFLKNQSSPFLGPRFSNWSHFEKSGRRSNPKMKLYSGQIKK